MRGSIVHNALFAATLLCFAACDSERDAGTDSVAADTGGTAVVALPADLDNANILVSSDRYAQEVQRYLLFLPLVQYDSLLGYEPRLARSYEFAGDTAVTFRLRDDVFWHDGRKTTAYDVGFTFERALDGATAFPNADWLIGWGKPQVIDSFTIRFPLVRMADPLGSVALLPIMPRHLLENIAPAETGQAAFNTKPVGNGPFRFVEYRPNERWVFEANRDFPAQLGGRPRLSRLILRVLPDPTAQIAELRAGNVDLALSTPADQFKQLDADSALRGIARPARQFAFIAWNTRRPPFDDARVRRALTHAIDRAEIVGVVRAGQGQPAVGPVSAQHWAFDTRLRPLAFSPDSARVLLAQAGWQDRNGDGTVENAQGKPLRIELMSASNSRAFLAMAEMIQADWKAVGVDLVSRAIDYATVVEQVSDRKRNFDAALMGFENDLRLNMHDMFHSSVADGPFQFASYRNPEADRAIDAASSEPDRTRAMPHWHRFQAIMREEQPWSVLFYMPDLYIVRERLQGTDMDIRGAFVNVTDWSIKR